MTCPILLFVTSFIYILLLWINSLIFSWWIILTRHRLINKIIILIFDKFCFIFVILIINNLIILHLLWRILTSNLDHLFLWKVLLRQDNFTLCLLTIWRIDIVINTFWCHKIYFYVIILLRVLLILNHILNNLILKLSFRP